jgi:hypothetical protein
MASTGNRAATAPTITQVPLPAAVRSESGLTRIDYSDAHLVTGPGVGDGTAEEWVRDMLAGAPLPLRRGLPPGWFLLGLHHGPASSPQHVLGWPIRESTADRVVLAAASRLGMPAELVLQRADDGWVFATLVRHDNAAMARLWAAIAGLHRRVVRQLLRSATRRRQD